MPTKLVTFAPLIENTIRAQINPYHDQSISMDAPNMAKDLKDASNSPLINVLPPSEPGIPVSNQPGISDDNGNLDLPPSINPNQDLLELYASNEAQPLNVPINNPPLDFNFPPSSQVVPGSIQARNFVNKGNLFATVPPRFSTNFETLFLPAELNLTPNSNLNLNTIRSIAGYLFQPYKPNMGKRGTPVKFRAWTVRRVWLLCRVVSERWSRAWEGEYVYNVMISNF